jgi:hypothetical protein
VLVMKNSASATARRVWIAVGAWAVLVAGTGYASAQYASVAGPGYGSAPQGAQQQPETQGNQPDVPPVSPPFLRQLPDGRGTLTLGDWLLYPTLTVNSLYDTNLYSSVTHPIAAGGFDFKPSIVAKHDTGIWQTTLYGNLDTTQYPFNQSQNDTHNRQAGFTQTYEAMRDLIFTVQGNYSHQSNASVITPIIPTSITSPATPAPLGAAGVAAIQQTIQNPNDVFALNESIYKALNRAFVVFDATQLSTKYSDQLVSKNYSTQTYGGAGGYWFSPLFYAYVDGRQAFQSTEDELGLSAYTVRGGIGSGRIGLFSGSAYYGRQGVQINSAAGTAKGDIYGGTLSYFPTSFWNFNLSVDRVINISNISTTTSAISNLPLAFNIGVNASARITTTSLATNYQWSAQTSLFGAIAYTNIDFIGGEPVENQWVGSVGVTHQLSQQLSLHLTYQYQSTVSKQQPSINFTRNYVVLGATYNF